MDINNKKNVHLPKSEFSLDIPDNSDPAVLADQYIRFVLLQREQVLGSNAKHNLKPVEFVKDL